MRTLVKLIGLFFENSKIRLAQAMAYRLNFVLEFIISFAQGLIAPLLQYLIFSQTRGVPGWNLEQMILFQGVLLFFMGLRWTLFGRVYFDILGLVRRGEFDRLLLKPYPAIGVILTGGFNPQASGGILVGPLLVTYAVMRMRLEIAAGPFLLALGLLAVGLLFVMGIIIMYCAAVIVLVNIGRLYDIFWTLERFGNYPLEVFPRAVRIVFMTIVPMAVWVNMPARVLLGRGDLTVLLVLLGSAGFFCLSLLVWRGGLKRYTSAGG